MFAKVTKHSLRESIYYALCLPPNLRSTVYFWDAITEQYKGQSIPSACYERWFILILFSSQIVWIVFLMGAVWCSLWMNDWIETYTGFPSVPVPPSKSPSSCFISTLEPLHHAQHPWLRRHVLLQIIEDSDRLLYFRPTVYFAQIWIMVIVLSRSRDLNNGTVFQLQFVDVHLLLNLNQN